MAERIVPWKASNFRTDLFSAFLRARRQFGGKTIAIVDGDERELSYDDIMKAALALGSALRRQTGSGGAVGILLPTGVGAVIAFYALSAYGRVPAMLNFTAGPRNLLSACKAAEVKTIVTSRKFVELAGLEPLLESLIRRHEIVYLEDVRENLTLMDKVRAGIGLKFPSRVIKHPSHRATGTILFTSGTEGAPKGVVLTHENILANVFQVLHHIALDPDVDVLFNPLPTFHCFGLTVGAFVPLLSGVKVVMHPTPLQPREIAKRVKASRATIMLATDTFVSQYARAGDEDDLKSLRLAVCGAERVRDETRALVRKKFGIELLEGYGVTEASPVVAANSVGGNRSGTVGKLMKDMEADFVPVEGITEGGRLRVRGPNIMKGYLRESAPGEIETLEDGWHDTGDIAVMEEDGFIRIKGRVKRFAKIGGEMVSLAVVENCASAIWPDDMHAAAVLPDKRKGEQIVLLSTAADADRREMVGWFQNHGVPELALPRQVFHVDEIPVLGTGKVNYGDVQRLAKTFATPPQPQPEVEPTDAEIGDGTASDQGSSQTQKTEGAD